MKQPLTIKQYVAALHRCKGSEGIEHGVSAWPYPQASQSHICFWRGDGKKINVRLIYSDCPGVLMCIAPDSLRPRDVVARLTSKDIK